MPRLFKDQPDEPRRVTLAGKSATSQEALRASALAMQGRRVLITGGTGYLASRLLEALHDVPCEIVRLTREASPSRQAPGRAAVIDVTGDIRDAQVWERALPGVEVVFHLAAQTSAQVANDDPTGDLATNVVPMVHLLEICRRLGSRPVVVFASTVTVIGLSRRVPVDEVHTHQPRTIYDLHKLMAEQYLVYSAREGFNRGIVLRLSNVYGPGPLGTRADRGVLNQWIRKALRGEPLIIYGEGDQVRDYVYVDDVTCAFLQAALSIERIDGRFFVIGSGRGHTIAEAANLVAERVALATDRRVQVNHIAPPRPASPIEGRSFIADTRAFRVATGWQALVGLPEGIDLTIRSLS